MDHSGKFKYLSEIAINLMIRPATSVPCERLFYRAGAVYEKKRYNLYEQLISAVLTLNNLWNILNIDDYPDIPRPVNNVK